MNLRRVVILLVLLTLVACGGTASAEPDADSPPSAPLSAEAAQGQKVFEASCAACHSTLEDAVIVGPSLFGIATVAGSRVEGQDAQRYLYTSVLNPEDYLVEGYDNLMPASLGKQLTGEELDAVVAYLMTLE